MPILLTTIVDMSLFFFLFFLLSVTEEAKACTEEEEEEAFAGFRGISHDKRGARATWTSEGRKGRNRLRESTASRARRVLPFIPHPHHPRPPHPANQTNLHLTFEPVGCLGIGKSPFQGHEDVSSKVWNSSFFQLLAFVFILLFALTLC